MLPVPVTAQLPLPDPGAAEIGPLAAVASSRQADPISMAGLGACVADARAAALSRAGGPPDPATFGSLRSRLGTAAAAMPPAFREAVATPFLRLLDRLGARGLADVVARDPEREGEARLVFDLAQAILQRGEGYQARATSAFQEVVSDLYQGFLSAEDRRGVSPPDHGVASPVVRWGSGEAGPYTWPATATEALGVEGALVSLPAANASAGLLAWPALAHETAGHDILGADDGLRDELARAVRKELVGAGTGPALAGYWAERIDESAADVLAVLNMGPAAAVGMLGYFRALNGAWRGTPALRNVGRTEDPHPADIVRAYLAAETVRLLSFRDAGRWADRLVAEADRDLGQVRLGDLSLPPDAAKRSAAVVARAIARSRLASLDGRSFGEIQDWKDSDEAVVSALRRKMRGGERGDPAAGASPGRYGEGTYAAHAVAAAVYEAASGTSPPDRVMARMIAMLDAMHARNPEWKGARREGTAPRLA